MYADDTSLYYSNNDIETLFSTVNMELEKISEWLLNYTLFYKNSTKDDLPLKLTDLLIAF